jgi:hypothetical protein
MWYAGVDWADDHQVVVVLDQAGEPLATQPVPHTVEGVAQLISFLLSIVGPPAQQEDLACLIATTRGLLIAALLEAGFPVYPVNPKTVDRHRKPAGAQTDLIDAYLLARTGRSDLADLRRLKPESALIQELKTLTRAEARLIASQTRLGNQLTACLKTYYPVALTLFRQVQRPSTLAFLQAYPTPQAAQYASLEDLTLILQQAKHRRLAHVGQRMWEHLRQPSDAAGWHHHAGQITLDAGAGPAASQARMISWPLTTRRLLASFKRMGISPSSAACQEQESGLRRVCWPNGAMTAHALPLRKAAKRWEAPHQCPLRAARMPRSTSGRPVSNLCARRSISSLGLWTFQEPWAEAYSQRKRQEGKTHRMAVRALSESVGPQYLRPLAQA